MITFQANAGVWQQIVHRFQAGEVPQRCGIGECQNIALFIMRDTASHICYLICEACLRAAQPSVIKKVMKPKEALTEPNIDEILRS